MGELPVRIVPGIAFIAMICGFVYVLRHLRKSRRPSSQTISAA
jgi:hypothetical protein